VHVVCRHGDREAQAPPPLPEAPPPAPPGLWFFLLLLFLLDPSYHDFSFHVFWGVYSPPTLLFLLGFRPVALRHPFLFGLYVCRKRCVFLFCLFHCSIAPCRCLSDRGGGRVRRTLTADQPIRRATVSWHHLEEEFHLTGSSYFVFLKNSRHNFVVFISLSPPPPCGVIVKELVAMVTPM